MNKLKCSVIFSELIIIFLFLSPSNLSTKETIIHYEYNVYGNPYNISAKPVGSAGPVIAALLEWWAYTFNCYYKQCQQLRDFEIHRQRLIDEFSTIQILIVDDEGDGNYSQIQDAINHSKAGDAILVYSGSYSEYLSLCKPLWLIGIENEFGIGNDTGKPVIETRNNNTVEPTITIHTDNTILMGFEIHSSSTGIEIRNHSDSLIVYDNFIITQNNSSAIQAWCHNSIIGWNRICPKFPNEKGIVLNQSNNTTLIYNTIQNTSQGIVISHSNHCYITLNTISHCHQYGIFFKEKICYRNIITMNNFIDNVKNAYSTFNLLIYENSWDANKSGNYWNDYLGVDTNGDGIGETAYILEESGIVDNYPLIEKFINLPPVKPNINPNEIGILCAKTDTSVPFYLNLEDPDGDHIYCKWLWGNTSPGWLGPYESGTTIEVITNWPSQGKYLLSIYYVQVIVLDPYGLHVISPPYEIHIYDLSAIHNQMLREFIDKLLPSYFLSGWN